MTVNREREFTRAIANAADLVANMRQQTGTNMIVDYEDLFFLLDELQSSVSRARSHLDVMQRADNGDNRPS